VSSRAIGENVERWKDAAFYPRHRAPLESVTGSIMEWGRRYFDRLEPARIEAAVKALVAPGGTVFLYGRRGTGKTQFAAFLGMAVAVLLGERDVAVTQSYYSLPQLMWGVKDGLAERSTAITVAGVGVEDLLVLDEVQDGCVSDFDRSTLTRILDRRYGYLRRTVLIANLLPDAIEATIGTSAYSRLCETGPFMEFTNEPYR